MKYIVAVLLLILSLFLLQVLFDKTVVTVNNVNGFLGFPIWAISAHYIFTRLWALACMSVAVMKIDMSIWKILFLQLKVFTAYYTLRLLYLVIWHDFSFREASRA